MVDGELNDLIVEVRRVNNRLMAIMLVVGELTFNVINGYIPHADLDEEVKRHFWEDLDELCVGFLSPRSFS